MDKYINGAIVKEMTLYLKKKGDLMNALQKLNEFLDLNLYDMKILDQAVYFELDEEYLKEHLISFLEEINLQHLPSFLDYSKKIDYIREHLDESLDDILDNCDDLFAERFRMEDVFSINDDSFYLDVYCYVFYFEGPYKNGNFDGLLQYLHMLQKNTLKSPLRGALCYGLNS